MIQVSQPNSSGFFGALQFDGSFKNEDILIEEFHLGCVSVANRGLTTSVNTGLKLLGKIRKPGIK